MAVTLTDIKVALGKDNVGGLATLDGLKQIDFDRVDMDYTVDVAEPVRRAGRVITLVYEPPSNTAAIDFYGNIGKYLFIERKIPAGAGASTTRYNTKIRQVIHRQSGDAYQDRYTVVCQVPDADLDLTK